MNKRLKNACIGADEVTGAIVEEPEDDSPVLTICLLAHNTLQSAVVIKFIDFTLIRA